MSPDFKQEKQDSEVYTPSFDHKNDIDFRKDSPLNLIDQLNDISARKTAEPPNMRKRRNKFKQRYGETPYIGHIMVNEHGQHVLQPLSYGAPRGMSQPAPVPLGKSYGNLLEENEEEKENMAPTQYYPT